MRQISTRENPPTPRRSAPRGSAAARKVFVTHGVAVTRVVGVIFILFGMRSIADAAEGAMKRTA